MAFGALQVRRRPAVISPSPALGLDWHRILGTQRPGVSALPRYGGIAAGPQRRAVRVGMMPTAAERFAFRRK